MAMVMRVVMREFGFVPVILLAPGIARRFARTAMGIVIVVMLTGIVLFHGLILLQTQGRFAQHHRRNFNVVPNNAAPPSTLP